MCDAPEVAAVVFIVFVVIGGVGVFVLSFNRRRSLAHGHKTGSTILRWKNIKQL